MNSLAQEITWGEEGAARLISMYRPEPQKELDYARISPQGKRILNLEFGILNLESICHRAFDGGKRFPTALTAPIPAA